MNGIDSVHVLSLRVTVWIAVGYRSNDDLDASKRYVYKSRLLVD